MAPRRPVVLVAEDDPDMRSLVVETLRRAELDVTAFANAARLLCGLNERWLGERELPEAVVTDLRMPGFDGFDLIDALRDYGDVPIVLVTAFGDQEVHESARARGVRAVLDKPFDLAVLRSVVKGLIEERRKS